MTDPVTVLKGHQPTKEYFIAIDSDGCAFDTMEIKHKECFTPHHIKHWRLQPVSKYARMASEFVNLYSKWRGLNRFPAVVMVFDLLADWDKVTERNVVLPEVPNLRRWMETESKLANPALEAYCAAHSEADEPDMHRALRWSKAINETVADMVEGVPPFPHVRESLARVQDVADMLVCSATPHDALVREWEEHGIATYPFAIAGQEQGKKSEHIAMAAGGKYDPSKMLMIGDAPGDLKAAKANGALFYPICPGDEDVSWARFHDEALDKFIRGEYTRAYEAALIEEFDSYLPDTPPWKQ